MRSSPSPLFGKIVICGMGVMGASLGFSLVSKKLCKEAYGLVRRPEIIPSLIKNKLIHKAGVDYKEALDGAEMVIVGVPSRIVPSMIKEMLPYLKPHMILSDLSSVKEEVIRNVTKTLGKKAIFLSVHPMTGTEKFGFEHFVPDLYKNAPCILTPHTKTASEILQRVDQFWKSLGSKTYITTPSVHDFCAGWISHLPHILSFLLFENIQQENKKQDLLLKMAAGSFRDMTRIAGSSPELWTDIFLSNKKQLLQILKRFQKNMNSFQNLLKSHSEKKLLKKLTEISSAKREMQQ